MCWQHAQKQHGLRVKPSQIHNAGFGLYATKRLAKNARIAPYTGDHLELGGWVVVFGVVNARGCVGVVVVVL